MKIIKSSEGLSVQDIFRMTQDSKVEQVKNHGGEVFNLESWVYYTDSNNNGKEVELLAMKTSECILTTNSATFIEQFNKMINYFDENGLSVNRIEVIENVNPKTGRTFFNVSYVD